MSLLERRQDETPDEWLLRLGELKEARAIQESWEELAELLNTSVDKAHSESWWRKRYHQLEAIKMDEAEEDPQKNVTQLKLLQIENNILKANADLLRKKLAREQKPPNVPNTEEVQRKLVDDIRRERVRARDERTAYNKMVRVNARHDALLDLFREEIQRFEPIQREIKWNRDEEPTAICAMLSDIHYGIVFHSAGGDYDSDIARERVMYYAEKIIEEGKARNAGACYVILLGDMISGGNHVSIRIENCENIVQQVIGVSELTAAFLYRLAEVFNSVVVFCVSGNHSRIEPNLDNALRAERLDSLIPWYCKTKLENVHNIEIYTSNRFDDSFATFHIHGGRFAAVHGDMDSDLDRTAMYIEKLTNHRPDYILGAHMHVPECAMRRIGVIRNGAVCGSGDEYTVRKRLDGLPYQVFFTVNCNGIVTSIHPVRLDFKKAEEEEKPIGKERFFNNLNFEDPRNGGENQWE